MNWRYLQPVVWWDGLGCNGLGPRLTGWNGVGLGWEPGGTGWVLDTIMEGPLVQGWEG